MAVRPPAIDSPAGCAEEKGAAEAATCRLNVEVRAGNGRIAGKEKKTPLLLNSLPKGLASMQGWERLQKEDDLLSLTRASVYA